MRIRKGKMKAYVQRTYLLTIGLTVITSIYIYTKYDLFFSTHQKIRGHARKLGLHSSERNNLGDKLTKSENTLVKEPVRISLADAYKEDIKLYQKFGTPLYCSELCRESADCTTGYAPQEFSKNYSNFVGSFAFRDMADFVINWKFDELYNYTRENSSVFGRDLYRTLPCLPLAPIIYIKPSLKQDIYQVFLDIIPDLPAGFFLVTGQSDIGIGNKLSHRDLFKSHKLIHWFGQNPLIQASKLTPIPIGVSYMSQAPVLSSLNRNVTSESIRQFADSMLKKAKSNDSIGLLAINFVPKDVPIRHDLLDKYCYTLGIHTNDSAFVRCFEPYEFNATFSLYESAGLSTVYETLEQLPFWLCPRGMGLDTYRIWEALYLGRFPVVQVSALNNLLSDLPVVVVKGLRTLTREFLLEELGRIRDSAHLFNLEKLRPKYWQSLMEEKRQEHLEMLGLKDNSRKRCWGP